MQACMIFLTSIVKMCSNSCLFLRLLVKHNALELQVSLYPAELFRNIGKFGAKEYFMDHQTANTIQLFIAIKGNFSGILFF